MKKGDVHFYLRPTGQSDQPIYLYFLLGEKYLRLSTGEKVNPKYWNQDKQRAKVARAFPQADGLNYRLDEIRDNVLSIYRKETLKGTEVTADQIKEKITVYLKGKPETKVTLFSFIEEFISTSKATKRPATIKVYKTTRNHLRGFEKASGYKVDFSTVNLDFYDKFMSYLLQDLSHSNNQAGKMIGTLKAFLNEATERGLNKNLDFRKKKFKVLKEEADNIYLTENELAKIWELDLSNNPRLEKVRDLFLVGCYTGLRFSDFTRLQKENVRDGEIRIRAMKTDQPLVIPLHTYVREILHKYDYQLPRSISNQKLNNYLKELGQIAGIDEETPIRRIIGGKKIQKMHPKWEKITSHTARRSFATNAYLSDMPSISIMKITGHTTEKAFMKYIKMSAEDNAKKLKQHPFFNKQISLRAIS